MRGQPESVPRRSLPVSVTLGISMVAAGVVYPVTDSALHHTSPIMIQRRDRGRAVYLDAAFPCCQSKLTWVPLNVVHELNVGASLFGSTRRTLGPSSANTAPPGPRSRRSEQRRRV